MNARVLTRLSKEMRATMMEPLEVSGVECIIDDANPLRWCAIVAGPEVRIIVCRVLSSLDLLRCRR